MARNIIETIMGAVVLVVAGSFLVFAYQQSAIKDVNGYTIFATFSDVSGISAGSDVRIGGMKVGVVEAMELDVKTYQANIQLQIRDDVRLPKDSSAAVVSSGLLGDKYIKVEPGGAEKEMAENDTIRFTQSSVSFEELIGKFVFSDGGVGQVANPMNPPSGQPEEAEPESEEDGSGNNPFSLGL